VRAQILEWPEMTTVRDAVDLRTSVENVHVHDLATRAGGFAAERVVGNLRERHQNR
jgi:hypothetical protein